MSHFKIIESHDNSAAPHAHRYRRLIVSAVLLVAGFGGGIIFGRVFVDSTYAGGGGALVNTTNDTQRATPSKPNFILNLFNKDAAPQAKDVNFNLYWDVWKRVQEQSLQKPVPDANLFYGSLEGMVASLKDPYSIFLRPQLATQFTQDLSGSFSGIGAEIGIKDEVITVIAPLPESPAEKAGVRAGDKIVQINGADTSGFSLDEAVSRIRGEKGTTVKLNLWRKGLDKPFDVGIVRDTIVIKSVTWKMEANHIAYIKIAHFNQDTNDLFAQAVHDIVAQNPKGLIVDLRNDPGGFLDSAVSVASEWIPSGDIVKEKFSDGHVESYATHGTHRLADVPTMVLVNQGSASASEIVAGALQDDGKGTLIGQKTFGKGSVQDYEQFEDGSALKLTIAEWLTPKDRHINKVGITPDVVIDDTQSAAPTSATSTILGTEDESKDPVFQKALKMLGQ